MRWKFCVALIAALIALPSLAREPIVVYLAGDSTMAEKLPEKRPETGWGEKLQQYFDASKVRIENHAKNGRSTRTFIEEGRWDAIVEKLRAGDYVFIQFGHNDSSIEKTDRYTPPAVYRHNLIGFVAEVRAKHANPILLTPVMRRRFDDQGVLQDSHGEYPDIVRAVAREYRVPLLDMHRSSMELLRSLGAEESKKLFLILAPGQSPNYPNGLNDNTHFAPTGAEEMAKIAVAQIKQADKALARKLLER